MAPEVRVAHRSDVDEIAGVLARAFFADPVGCYFFPDEQRRGPGLERFFALQLRNYYLAIGEAYTTQPCVGAALWLAPAHRRTPLRDLVTMFRVFHVVWGRVRETTRFGAALAANRPKIPHYYLGTIGVEPALHGRGVGSTLMQPVLTRCDAQGTPAYLECSKEETIPFYEKHGFVVDGELATPGGGPRIWRMWREAC